MTSMTRPVTAHVAPAVPEPRLTWAHVVAAEARRLRTLRSTWWFAAVLVLLVALVGVFPAIGVALGALEAAPPDAAALGGALSGMSAAGLLVTAFGVLAASGEYTTGVVAATFTAVPRRTAVVLARGLAVGVAVLVPSLVLTFGTYGLARVLLAAGGVDLPTAPGTVGALTGAAFGPAGQAVLGVAAGWLLRSTAGGITAVVVLLHMVPAVGLVLPATVADRVLPWMPINTIGVLMTPGPVQGMPAAWAALAALVAYVAAALALAALAVRRRDV
jgi:ABC-2 type transport system permease protein